MAPTNSFYITTPIYYVNDVPHIGHAYTSLACDVIARFKRLDGFDVMFLTGTDEHGEKVDKSAKLAGVEAQAFCDRVSGNFRALSDVMHFSNDDFIRTTEDRHTAASQSIWRALMDAGEIYLGTYAGWYSVRDEAFYAESEVVAGAAGEKIAPSGAPVGWVEEPSYFFRLSAWADRLLEFYRTHPDFILPESRRNEVVSFVAGGLRDLSVSRTSFDWGVPVPDDPAHVMYVWLDALTNYITAVGYPDTECAAYQRYWPADIHMVGKDILRFHAVYWPAFLMAAGVEPPKRVFAHGWWTNEGHKISKSLGNVIDPVTLVETFGVDAVRYFLMREVPFGNDGDFSRRAMIGRLNGDLANDFGNLAQRVLSMIQRYCDGKLPAPGPLDAADAGLMEEARGLLAVVRPLIDRQAIHEMLIHLWAAIANANRYVDQQAPWALKRTDVGRMSTVLYVLAEVIRHYAILALAVMPQSAERMLNQLAVPANQRAFASLGPEGALVPETLLPKPEGIFPRFVDDDDQKIA